MKIFTAVVAAYFLGFLLTYGHAFNTRDDTYMFGSTELKNSDSQKAAESLAIAAFWPLYLSVRAWGK